MATVQLRLRGVTPIHLTVAAVAAAPLASVAYLAMVRHVVVPFSLVGLAALGALLPWLSWLAARVSYRAKCDDIAVHLRGEALPYKTLTEVRVIRSPRRTVLVLRRGETVELRLVLRDLFAGRLEPYDELAHRLAQHGHPIPGPGLTVKPDQTRLIS